MHKKQVFLGGTCNESSWREELIPLLDILGLNYFNPVVDDWTEEAYQNELLEKAKSDYELYTITPKMTGTFSIAEVVDCSNKTPERTIFCLLVKDDEKYFEKSQWKSLLKVGEMVSNNGGKVCESFEELIFYFQELKYENTNFLNSLIK